MLIVNVDPFVGSVVALSIAYGSMFLFSKDNN